MWWVPANMQVYGRYCIKLPSIYVHAGNPTFIVEKFGSRCVAQYLGYRLGHLHSLLECLPWVWALLLSPVLVDVHPRRHHMMVQVLTYLLPTWTVLCSRFLALIPPSCGYHLESESVNRGSFFSISTTWINKYNFKRWIYGARCGSLVAKAYLV